jgi:hypothetical protein
LPDLLLPHYITNMHLYKLVVNFNGEKCLTHKANDTINIFCGENLLTLLSQHISLCPEMQLADRLSDSCTVCYMSLLVQLLPLNEK